MPSVQIPSAGDESAISSLWWSGSWLSVRVKEGWGCLDVDMGDIWDNLFPVDFFLSHLNQE